MKQNLRASVMSVLAAVGPRVGAVVLAIATIAAIVFAILNFDQRTRFESPDDGVVWWDTDHGVEARYVLSNSPAQQAGIRPGDVVREIDGQKITHQTARTSLLWKAGPWTQL